MAKRRRQPSAPPPQGDIGPDAPAQRAGATITVHREANGADFRRKRREHPLEVMLAGGRISQRQCIAGLRLHSLWCLTELSGECAFSRVKVDTSSRADDSTVAQLEHIARYVALAKHVPRALKGPVEHVAIRGRHLRDGYSRNGMDAASHAAMMMVALDLVANEMGV